MAGQDLPTLESTLQWLKEKRNQILGFAAVAGLAVVVTVFVKGRLADRKYLPWREFWTPLLTDGRMPWDSEPEQLADVLAAVQGTAAEPITLYWEALRRYDTGDQQGAAERLLLLNQEFDQHYLLTTELPDPDDPASRISPANRIQSKAQVMAQWDTDHPSPQDNPDPPPGNTLTITTERGPIVLGLYVDHAPMSCAAIVALAESFEGSYAVTVSPDEWVDLGQQEDGTGTPVADDVASEAFPPFEENGLWHFAGSVAFRQAPFGDGPRQMDLRVWLTDSFREDGRSTVFAKVIEGLPILESLSNEKRSEERPGLLTAPLPITDVLVSLDSAEEGSEPPPEEGGNQGGGGEDGSE